VVWARGGVVAERCPRSLVSAASWELLERYNLWRYEGRAGLQGLPAKQAEAFMFLESERARVGVHGEE